MCAEGLAKLKRVRKEKLEANALQAIKIA